jgi:hypothetical protein
MNTQVSIVQQLPISELMNLAKAFAESGMFSDTKSAAQAIVKIQAGQEIGIPPFASMTGIHIIQGKPTIGAGLIASRLKGSGKYDYRVVEASEKVCSIDFFQGATKIGNSTFTIEDAKKALTKNIDKFPKNMLFARAISNGVKWYCPDIFSGPVYVPEEMQVVTTEEATHIEVDTNIDRIINDIQVCESLDELQSHWKAIKKEFKTDLRLIAAKDDMKVKLTPKVVINAAKPKHNETNNLSNRTKL